ncbi:type VI secretion system Vgr family protein [Sorangium sp. So ce385]|uniref:type VI secretion system Vgr family protein n=1 Tax=Sorangium sp. So ce385 TaxID=3133308 RepID=UPI003F5C09E8
MPTLKLTLFSGEDSLVVHRFAVHEAISMPFSISVWARSPDPAMDLGAIVGRPGTFHADAGYGFAHRPGGRTWSGLVSRAEQVHAVKTAAGQQNVSTYHFRLVPTLWQLTQRRNQRIYQHLSIPDIIDRLLGEWRIQPVWRIDRRRYPKLEYKVQYAETDYLFLSRLLEEAGIAFTFADDEGHAAAPIFSDRLEATSPRSASPLLYIGDVSEGAEREFVTGVRLSREVRPGTVSVRDHDFRRPTFPLAASARTASAEDRCEQYRYRPGAFLVETGKPAGSPVADDQGFARHDSGYGDELVHRELHGERVGVHGIAYETNAFDVVPGVVFSVDSHPHPELPAARKLLVVESSFEGTPDGEWTLSGQAVFADSPYRPPRRAPKPVVHGFQSAVVVGPSGQEIHTDEFGRVRVQLAWDREGQKDEHSSCWMRVHQGWGGAGWGMLTLPRIGQEVLVTFLQGDPDQPVVVGRTYNAVQSAPYALPEHRTRSTWKSDSSPGAGGFNEVMFEDLKGKELVWQQAQKDRKRLVKNDEQSTVGHDRQKLVKNDESERIDGYVKRSVSKDVDAVTKGDRRERIEGSCHLEVRASYREEVRGTQSRTVEQGQQERVGGRYALRAAKKIHVVGEDVVGQGADDVTIRGPGGFIRLDAAGVTIKGTLVKINVSGSPGKGGGAHPGEPEEPVGVDAEDT